MITCNLYGDPGALLFLSEDLLTFCLQELQRETGTRVQVRSVRLREKHLKTREKQGLFMPIRRVVVEAVDVECLSQVEGGAMGQDRVVS